MFKTNNHMPNVESIPDVGIDFERIGPSKARNLLETNVKNRTLNPRVVRFLARQMTEGKWRLNGDAIRFDWDGKLLDGQHRLAAVIESGTVQPFIVVRGLDPEAQLTIDVGRRRTTGDVLKMEGFPYHSSIASAVKLLVLYYDNRLDASMLVREVTNEEVKTFAMANRDDLIYSIQLWNFEYSKRLWEPSTACMAHFVFSRSDSDAADEFMSKLRSGHDMHEGNPILAYRHRLEREALKTDEHLRKGYAWKFRNLVTSFKTWNAWREGRSVSRVLTPRGPDITLPELV